VLGLLEEQETVCIETAETLLGIERELASGDGDAYRRRLSEDAVVIVPGKLLDKEATVAAMDASPGWTGFWVDECCSLRLDSNAALITYRLQGRRGDFDYAAILSSVYVRNHDGWKLAFHQQTPIDAGVAAG
jgi:hypothetical protein